MSELAEFLCADFPQANERGESYVDAYLHRIGRAGRFGTKGMAISFVSGPEDEKAFEEVQQVFADVIPELPDTIDQSDYSTLDAHSAACTFSRIHGSSVFSQCKRRRYLTEFT